MSSNSSKAIQGTREWAVATVDCCLGCPNGCLYCYARYDQVHRKKLVTERVWNNCQILEDVLLRSFPLYDGQVMFPAHHDIVPDNLDACLTVIQNLLDAGNRVLLVSKPLLSCFEKICEQFSNYSDQLLFRFTITARDENLLAIWEPNAPDYQERLKCLQYVCQNGFQTSVSVEPMLDCGDVVDMVHELLPHVTHSIWIGKMNKIDKRVRQGDTQVKEAVERIIAGQQDDKIVDLYNRLQHLDRIRWKESIKDVIGLDRASEPGLDR